MRLICPRCGAQYEIDGAAIPRGGRDVECSACSNVWRAVPAAEPFDPDARPPLSRPLSESVIGILREEAARELEVRAAERQAARQAELQGRAAQGAGAGAAESGPARPDAQPPADILARQLEADLASDGNAGAGAGGIPQGVRPAGEGAEPHEPAAIGARQGAPLPATITEGQDGRPAGSAGPARADAGGIGGAGAASLGDGGRKAGALPGIGATARPGADPGDRGATAGAAPSPGRPAGAAPGASAAHPHGAGDPSRHPVASASVGAAANPGKAAIDVTSTPRPATGALPAPHFRPGTTEPGSLRRLPPAASYHAVSEANRAQRGHDAGFHLAVMVALIAVALYALAPRLADQGVVGEQLMEWRAQVDQGRAWLAAQAEPALVWLRSLFPR